MLFVNNIRENAKKIINKDLIKHFCAVMFPVICGICFIYSAVVLSDIVMMLAGETVSGLVLFAFLFFTVAMTIPLFYGLAVFESNCASSGKADFADMFCGFSSMARYFRSICFFYAMLWRFLLVFSVPIILINEFSVYNDKSAESVFIPVSAGGFDLTYTLVVICIILSLMASVCIYSKYIFAAYFVAKREDAPVSECFFAAKVYRYDCANELGKLASSFVPLMLLSVVSFGIIAVYTLPFTLSAIYLFAHERYTSEDMNSSLKDKLFAK